MRDLFFYFVRTQPFHIDMTGEGTYLKCYAVLPFDDEAAACFYRAVSRTYQISF